MAETKVIMPQMGESIFEGTLTKWLKKEGDKVSRDEPLFEISTDKVDSEIPAPAAGVLQKILVKEGQTVEINTVVAIIGEGDGKPVAAEASTAATRPPAAGKPQAAPPPAAPQAPPPEPAGEDQGDEPDSAHSSPLVRKIAKEHGIDLKELAGKGTGINGRITKSDILSYIEQRGPAAQPTKPAAAVPAGDVERVPMSVMRKAIAEHMVLSRRTSAHVTTFFEVDCTNILKAREQLKPEFERAGTRLTVTPFFVHAAVQALKRFPLVNASLDGETIVYRKAIHIGVAVNLETGLIVPVVKNAGEENLQGLTHAINDLGERARTKKLTPDDVKDGTFTITNPGQYGAVTATPIINQPQVAIMGMGGIKKRVVAIDDTIGIRPMIMLALSFDHRIVDGALADQFMAEVQKNIEGWTEAG